MSARAAGLRHLLAALPALLGLAVVTTTSAETADDPRLWLRRMGTAVEELNYQGSLVHVHGGETVVLEVVQRVEQGRVIERIKARDGGREIIRSDVGVQYILPDQRTVLIEERDETGDSASPLRGNLPGASGVNDALYHVSFNGSDKVAGRAARGIAIRPKDAYRYGYRIWVDQATAMPLRTQLVDERGAVLEQVFFTEVHLPARIAESAVQPSVATQAFAVRRSAVAEREVDRATAVPWMARQVPPGFSLLRQARRDAAGEGGMRHMVYSDGLATVSLFIEPAVAASEQAEGLSQIGAANAYTAIVGGYMVTAIGEVPPHTVEMLARSASMTQVSD